MMGVQIVRNAVSDDEKELERKTGKEEIRKREERKRQAERQMKMLQGMVFQISAQKN
jgi:Sec-independent protein translocase protein TatA